MPFTPKNWQDGPTGGTPINAAALIDLETRVMAGISVTTGVPANITLPTITGLAIVGSTLVASPGTWTAADATFNYQWSQGLSGSGSGTTPSGTIEATGPTYTLQSVDAGKQVFVLVTGTNLFGASNPVASLPTAQVTTAAAPVPVNTALPTVSGTPQVGQTLTATTGTWSNTPTSYRYQWQQSGANPIIIGATSSTYVVQSSDIGINLKVLVYASNANGESTAATSISTAPVTTVSGTPTPVSTSPPGIGGTPQVGTTLLVTPGTWTNSPTSYTFQWKWYVAGQNGVPILGATLQGYIPVAADVGHQLYVTVAATNSGGSGYAASANTVAVVAAAAPPPPPPPGSATVKRAPFCPYVPASGWTPIFADGFGTLDTNYWFPNMDYRQPVSAYQYHGNSPAETAFLNNAQVQITSSGCQLVAIRLASPITASGQTLSLVSGAITAPHRSELQFMPGASPGGGGQWAFEIVCTLPYNEPSGGADPGWWAIGGGWSNEFDFFEYWGWTTWFGATYGTWLINSGSHTGGDLQATTQPGHTGSGPYFPEFTDQKQHTWTHVFNDDTKHIDVYIDGILRGGKPYPPSYPNTVPTNYMRLLCSFAYRGGPLSSWTAGSQRPWTIRSIAAYRDTGHVGSGYIGGGTASGTSVV